MGWTTAMLEARARLYAGEADAGSGGLTSAEVLQLADDELQSYCFPRLLKARGEYSVTYSDTTLTSGTAAYTVPARAYLGQLRDVLFVSTSGTVRSLALIQPEEIGHGFAATTTASEPSGFYMRGKSVVLWPTPSASAGTLRLMYVRKPSTLVATSACALVSGVTPSGANSNCAASTGVPGTWASTEVTDISDPARTEEPLYVDVSATSVNTGTDTWVYVTANASALAVGHYVSLDGETCVPHLPEPLLPWLAMRTATAILEARGDLNALGAARSKAQAIEDRLESVLKPRIDGEPTFVTTSNSPYRAARGGAYRAVR